MEEDFVLFFLSGDVTFTFGVNVASFIVGKELDSIFVKEDPFRIVMEVDRSMLTLEEDPPGSTDLGDLVNFLVETGFVDSLFRESLLGFITVKVIDGIV